MFHNVNVDTYITFGSNWAPGKISKKKKVGNATTKVRRCEMKNVIRHTKAKKKSIQMSVMMRNKHKKNGRKLKKNINKMI